MDEKDYILKEKSKSVIDMLLEKLPEEYWLHSFKEEIDKQFKDIYKTEIIDAYVTGRFKDKNIKYGIEYYNKLDEYIEEGKDYYNKTYEQ